MAECQRLAEKAWLISERVPVDGRVSWIAPGTGVSEPYNQYLLEADERVLLVDTGVALHGPGLIAQLEPLIENRRLIVYLTRIELDCIGNLAAILDRFPGTEVVTANPISPVSLVHRAKAGPIAVHHVAHSADLSVVGFGHIRVIDPPIRTLGTSWLFDRRARIVFTSDSICAELAAGADSPTVRRDLVDPPDASRLRANILAKFDWLAQADRPSLLRRWDMVFDTLHPAVLAPIHGRPSCGEAVIESVLASYRAALASCTS